MPTEHLALRHTPIVGLHFRPADVKALVADHLSENTELVLRREPDNGFDNLAIAVDMLHDGQAVHIGFIPKTINPLLASFLDNGYASRVALTKLHPTKPEISVYITAP